MTKINNKLSVDEFECPLFVPLVEEGLLEGPIVSATVEYYLKNLDLSMIDTLILGCTHYPLLKPVIKKYTNNLMLIDSADSLAKEVHLILKNDHMMNNNSGKGTQDFYVTDSPSNFKNIAKRFLGYSVINVKTASIS